MKGIFFSVRPFCFASLMFLLVLISGCRSKTNNYEPVYSEDSLQTKTLLYGVSTHAFHELNTAFAKYLNERLDSARFELVASSYFSAYVDKLEKRYFDMAGANGFMTLESIRNGYSILAASVDNDANAGVIIVNKDSSINNFSDLEGKSIASAGSPALGHMLPMVYLVKKGLDVNNKVKLKYVESFESVILNVYLGRCSVGFATINGWHSFIKRRPEIASKVALKWITPAVPGNTLLIRNTVNKKTVSQLKNLILTMHMNEQGRKALANLGYIKFVAADSNTYLPFKDLLKEYRELIVDPNY